MEKIRVEKGELTVLVAERRVGMTTFLCEMAVSAIASGESVLVISSSYKQALDNKKAIADKSGSPDMINMAVAEFEVLEKMDLSGYDLIIFDTPNLFRYDGRVMGVLLKQADNGAKIVVGITWENICFDDKYRKVIVEQFTNRTASSYYITTNRYNQDWRVYSIPYIPIKK